MPIPTNLITGFLGVGKTTAVIDLLRRKPPESRWAVLVNEYGDVSIDTSLIEGDAPDGVTVREVAGGCVCCASAPYLPVALHFLLLDARPDRLLIETTGLGHPARLLDTLRTNYRDRLDLRATLCLVDPADFAQPAMKTNPVFLDQVQLADVLVMNKLDAVSPEVVADFQAWANGLFPRKLLIAGTTYGRLDAGWLDLAASDERLPLYPGAHEHSHNGTASESSPSTLQLTRTQGSPVRFESPPGVHSACGWIFPPDTVFDEDRLISFLRTVTVIRLKGVFHAEHEWVAVNRSTTGTTISPTAYRRDSRLEVFADVPNWDNFERDLLACVTPSSAPKN